MDEAKPEF